MTDKQINIDDLSDLNNLKLEVTREDKKRDNLKVYVPVIEKLGAVKLNDHWKLGKWFIFINRRCSVRYAYNQRWVINIEKFLENPQYWIEEGEKQYKEYCERRRIKKQSAKNAH